MKNKKNIDNLFNESFKNFEATPSSRVWENIETELNKEKRNRKPIPLWIKYGGVAALLALFLTVGNRIYKSFEPIQNSITNENVIDPGERLQQNEDKIITKSSENQVVTEFENSSNISTQENDSQTNTNQKNNITQKSNSKTTKIANTSNGIQKNTSEEQKTKVKGLPLEKYQKNAISKSIVASKNTSDLAVNKSNEKNIQKNSEDQLIKNKKNIYSEVDKMISTTENSEKIEKELPITEETADSKNKKSILDAIAENDSLNDSSIKEKNENLQHRWNVTPNVAPVYYSSLGNGSSIDPEFANNPQKGDVNMSYGLQVSYAISERLSVRTGMNSVDLSYSTSNIVIGTGPASRALPSVDYGTNQIVVTAISRESLGNHYQSNDFGDITLKSTSGDARLIQSMSYYEVPLELKYALINSKFGVNIIGGVSTLFLGNNEISVKSDNFSSVLGEANNLSNVSFSTNVGLGLDYKLSKKFIVNIEPMFKYQLNPYTDSTVNFKPYYLGVYSGLSFKF